MPFCFWLCYGLPALAAVNAVAGLTLLAVAAWLTLGMVGSALQDGAQSGDRG